MTLPSGTISGTQNDSRISFNGGATTEGLVAGTQLKIVDGDGITQTVTISSIASEFTIHLTVPFPGSDFSTSTFRYSTSNNTNQFAVYSGTNIAFQVSGDVVMSGSTDLLDIFASSGITNQDVYWSANTDSSISPSGSNATTSVNISGNLGVSGITTSTGGFVGDLVGTATTATTVLVTDNESGNDNNLLVFVGEGTTTTGSQSLQMDGDLYYNPSIGKLHVPLTFQMPDNGTIKLGASQDLKLYHDEDNSYIKENGTGDLIIQTNSNVIIEGTGGENCAVFVDEGGVELYYDNTKKFETTTDGVTMAGAIAMGTNKVTGMGDPTAAQDAATKNYVDTKTQMDWVKTTAGIKLLSSNNWVGFNRTTGGLDSSGFWNVDCLGTALSDVHAFYSSYYNTVFTAPYGGHLKRLLIQGANTTNAGAVGEDWNIYLAKSPVVNDSDSISWSQVTAFTRTFPDDRDKRFIYDIPLNGTTGVVVSQYDTFLLAFQGTNGTNTWVTANIILEFEYNI